MKLKRIIDLILSISALIILSPVLLLISFLVLIKLGPPIFFRQQRAGFNSKPFILLKFRTMTQARDIKGNSLPDDERLTSFGRFLRNTSLDELPELINVIKGEMSLVGPRPLLMQYLTCYTPEQARRHEAKPGITGWAQINGRNDLMFSKRIAMDIWYVDNWNLGLDFKILLLTVIKVLKKEGVRSGQNFMEVYDLKLNEDLYCKKEKGGNL